MKKKIWFKWQKRALRLAAAAALAVSFSLAAGELFPKDTFLTVLAAESSVIESLTVTFKTTYGEPEEIPEPEISISGQNCSLGDIQYGTSYDRWRPGRKVRVEITVHAENGKLFPVSLTGRQCRVSGANFASARALDDTTLQVKVDYVPVTVLGDTSLAGWNSSGRLAVWEPVEYAPGYSLVLYGDDRVVKRLTVEESSVDLSPYMTDPNMTYYYEVKAIPLTSEERKYLKEGDFVASKDQDMELYLQENSADGGSLKGGQYVLPNGTIQTSIWKKIGGSWYYFDENGNMATGWRMIGNIWYYFNGSGKMQTGWVNPDGNWYYLDPDGAMLTGWIEAEPSVWYYLNPISDGTRGKMLTGWIQVNGKWYYMDPSGRMAFNTTVDGWTVGPDGAWIE